MKQEFNDIISTACKSKPLHIYPVQLSPYGLRKLDYQPGQDLDYPFNLIMHTHRIEQFICMHLKQRANQRERKNGSQALQYTVSTLTFLLSYFGQSSGISTSIKQSKERAMLRFTR